MKIFCLLVCLVAHQSSGSIFKRHHSRPMQGLDVQPLEYIDTATYNQLVQQEVQAFEDAQRSLADQDYLNTETAEASSHENNEQYRVNIQEYVAPSNVESQNQRQNRGQNREHNREQMKNVPRFYASTKNANRMEMQPTYGDSVAWRDIQMAVGPRSPIAESKDIARIFEDAYETLKDLTFDEKMKYHAGFMSEQNKEENSKLNATQMLQKYQYAVEEHTVKTDDGYILTLFRIPPKPKTRDVQKRQVVFLMHGLLGSADDWLLMGPGKSLAYMLADADYDVWMGNARGNKYSRRHVSKHPAQPEFWQFSNDEIALHDLPAMIDYALETTQQEKLHYVGFSEGTTVFFALAATQPKYNDKIISMHALAPMVYMSHTRSPLMKMIAPSSPFYERLHQQLGHGEFKPSQEMIKTVGGDMLINKLGCAHAASNLNMVMAGPVDDYDPTIISAIVDHLPAGASTRQMKHYGQAVASHEFRRYDYGPSINQKVYGSTEPPKYKLKSVRAPVTLYHSAEDWLAHPLDVEKLRAELPAVQESYEVPQPHFTHLDFQFSKKAPEVVYNRLIESIQKNHPY